MKTVSLRRVGTVGANFVIEFPKHAHTGNRRWLVVACVCLLSLSGKSAGAQMMAPPPPAIPIPPMHSAIFDRVEVTIGGHALGRLKEIKVGKKNNDLESQMLVESFAKPGIVSERKGIDVGNVHEFKQVNPWLLNGDLAKIVKHTAHPAGGATDVLQGYEAQSQNDAIQAVGRLTAGFGVTAPAEPDQLLVEIKLVNPVVINNAGIEIYYEVTRKVAGGGIDVLNGPTWVKYQALDQVPGTTDRKTTVKIAGENLRNRRNDVVHGSIDDLIYVRVGARVWANAKGNIAPNAPFITPEPATWLLGLTGLAAVIGTQVWKKRYPKSAV